MLHPSHSTPHVNETFAQNYTTRRWHIFHCPYLCVMAVCSRLQYTSYNIQSADSQPKSVGLVWGLAASRRSVCIHQMNRVNSRNDHGHEDSTVNIVVELLTIIITFTRWWICVNTHQWINCAMQMRADTSTDGIVNVHHTECAANYTTSVNQTGLLAASLL